MLKRLIYFAVPLIFTSCIVTDDLEPEDLNNTMSGLAIHLTFDNRDANDSSGNNYHGVLGGTNFISNTPSGVGYAYNIITPNDLLRIPYNPFKGIVEYSFCFWVRDPSQGLLMNAYGYNVDNTTYNFPQVRISDNLFYTGFASYSSDCHFSYDPATTLQDGEWHHVAITATPEKQSLFVDGYLISNQQSSMGESESSEVHFGGALSGYAGAIMKIDDIRIYTRAITPSEISSIITLER